jgi:WD40 repeat protein
MRWLWFVFSAICLSSLGHAGIAESDLITASNIDALKSVLTVEFADLQAARIENGWFALSPGGEYIATISRNNKLIVWNALGQIVDSYAIQAEDGLTTTVMDAAFHAEPGMLASTHTAGNSFYVVYRYLESHFMEYYRFESTDVPLRIWKGGDVLSVWLEVAPNDSFRRRYVLRLNPFPLDRIRINEVLGEQEYIELPSGPENDPDSFLRIGRIDPPHAITVTRDFLIKRWNLETGEVTASAQLKVLPGAGHLTPDGRYFAWRDGDSTALYRLDFETGENQLVAPLNSTYLPFLLLNITGDVIIGVNAGLQPIVVAWNVATGLRHDLGNYRSCRRQPDMARLSQDGTTLVVGCDSGLDIWRVTT